MEIIAHRINTVKELRVVPEDYGTEIDVRAFGNELILNHEPFETGERLEEYLDEYKHGTLVLNIKEAGIEDKVISLVKRRNIKSYFLLDVEYPYILQKKLIKPLDIAVRFSEQETIQNVKIQRDRLKWVWIDCVTRNPVTVDNMTVLTNFKKCFVCPSRWGRAEDIPKYKKFFNDNMQLDAVMTELKTAKLWNKQSK